MKKIKILYVISTLRPCGPVNVLYNIIKFMDINKFDVNILTFSNHLNAIDNNFIKLGVNVINLNLSRVQMHLFGKRILKKSLVEISPDIIHTHCFRSSLYIASFSDDYITCTTLHNYPHKDFLFLYGKIIGKLILQKYLQSIKQIRYRIACSKSISDELQNAYAIKSRYILNGIDMEKFKEISINEKNKIREILNLPTNKKILISVGSLSKRKNPEFIIDNFIKSNLSDELCLCFLGDGELINICRKKMTNDIFICGAVNNVNDYLNAADFFVSASQAEGMPNAALEAMANGKPVLLSDIGPHKEIYELDNRIGNLFNLEGDDFIEKLQSTLLIDYKNASLAAKKLIKEKLSAQIMSEKYQDFYYEVIHS